MTTETIDCYEITTYEDGKYSDEFRRIEIRLSAEYKEKHPSEHSTNMLVLLFPKGKTFVMTGLVREDDPDGTLFQAMGLRPDLLDYLANNFVLWSNEIHQRHEAGEFAHLENQ